MGLFKRLFGNTEDSNSAVETRQLPEIRREDFVDDSEPKEEVYSVAYGTRMPIDAIYAFIDRDYEQLGYDDAMCNADSAYKHSKKEIIKNELKRLFEQVRLRYKSDLRDIEVQIGIVEQQGLINTSASLKARKDTFVEHMDTMTKMEQALDNEEPQMLGMTRSYERGFLKGLAAKSDILLKNGKF